MVTICLDSVFGTAVHQSSVSGALQHLPSSLSNCPFNAIATSSGRGCHEQLLLPKNMPPSGPYAQQLHLRQTGSTPSLLPLSWQTAPLPSTSTEILHSSINRHSGLGAPLPSPAGLDLSALYRGAS